MESETVSRFGKLAEQFGHLRLPLQILKSAGGYYLGTMDDTGPVSRESEEYFDSSADAQAALDTGAWTQREHP